jgi:hypothetical protein
MVGRQGMPLWTFHHVRSIPFGSFLAFVTGLANQALLLRNEYLIAENRIFAK